MSIKLPDIRIIGGGDETFTLKVSSAGENISDSFTSSRFFIGRTGAADADITIEGFYDADAERILFILTSNDTKPMDGNYIYQIELELSGSSVIRRFWGHFNVMKGFEV